MRPGSHILRAQRGVTLRDHLTFLKKQVIKLVVLSACVGSVAYLAQSGVFHSEIPYRHRTDYRARVEADGLAHDTFFLWLADNGDKTCPASIDDLQKYSGIRGMKDPWGEKFQLFCSVGTVAIVSAGPDRKMRTEDDIISRETTNRGVTCR